MSSRPCDKMGCQSGRGAAWLARLLGVQEVPGSNPGGPTKAFKDLQPADLLRPLFWSQVDPNHARAAFLPHHRDGRDASLPLWKLETRRGKRAHLVACIFFRYSGY